METAFLILRLLSDLGVGSGNNGVSMEEKINNWIHSEQGMKVIGDIDQLLTARGIDFQISVVARKKI